MILDEEKLLLERNYAEEFLNLKTQCEQDEVNAQLKWNKKK